jgi:allantoin racemase
MKIMVINPNTSKSMTKHLENVLNPIKGPDTELTVVCPDEGPDVIECALDEAASVMPTLKLVQRANEEGYDACILACFSDPGLEQAREISNILVTGIEEISMHMAAMMGAKFSVMTLNQERVPSKTMHARRFRMEASLASVRPLDMSVAETDADPVKAKARILAVARKAVEEDGAEVIILGCAGMAGYADDIVAELGVPVIDPSSVALKITEGMVAAGLKQSKRGYYSIPPRIRRAQAAQSGKDCQ